MESRLKRMDVEAAKDDLKHRTLASLKYDLAKVLYLSSLRDFSTGEYHHDGLALSFSESAANEAMSACHQEAFYSLVLCPLSSFVEQVDRFIRSTAKNHEKTFEVWERLEPFNVAVPSVCEETAADLFRSNIKVAMALLKSPQSFPEIQSQSALRPLLPGR
jgi:hypothetical protein